MHRPTSHLPHLLLFLQAVESMRRSEGSGRKISMPKEAFLLREEEHHFTELIGFSIRGFPSLIVGGLRFRRQKPGQLCRQSLVSYLSATSREISVSETPAPAHLLELMVSDQRQPIHDFLKSSREGQRYPAVRVSKKDVRFAFDFRLANPSRSHQRQTPSAARARHLFRTEEGHILSAIPHQLPAKLHRDDPFLALTQPTQHALSCDRPLPTVVAHRDYLTMATDATENLTPWLYGSSPFHVELANADHFLDSQLENYRAYRSRELQENRRDAPLAATA